MEKAGNQSENKNIITDVNQYLGQNYRNYRNQGGSQREPSSAKIKDAQIKYKYDLEYIKGDKSYAIWKYVWLGVSILLPLGLPQYLIKAANDPYRNSKIDKMTKEAGNDLFFDKDFQKVTNQKEAQAFIKNKPEDYPFILKAKFDSSETGENVLEIECKNEKELQTLLKYFEKIKQGKTLRNKPTRKILTILQAAGYAINIGWIGSAPNAPTFVPPIKPIISHIVNFEDRSEEPTLYFLTQDRPLFNKPLNDAYFLRPISESVAKFWAERFPEKNNGRITFGTKLLPQNPKTISSTTSFNVENAQNLIDPYVYFDMPRVVEFDQKTQNLQVVNKTNKPGGDFYTNESNDASFTLKNQFHTSLSPFLQRGPDFNALDSIYQKMNLKDTLTYVAKPIQVKYIKGKPHIVIENQFQGTAGINTKTSNVFKYIGLAPEVLDLLKGGDMFPFDSKHIAIPFKSEGGLRKFTELKSQINYKLPTYLTPKYKDISVLPNINNNNKITAFIPRANSNLIVTTKNGQNIDIGEWLRTEFKNAGISNIKQTIISDIYAGKQIYFDLPSNISQADFEQKIKDVLRVLDQVEYSLPVYSDQAFLTLNIRVTHDDSAIYRQTDQDHQVVFSNTISTINEDKSPFIPGAVVDKQLKPGNKSQTIFIPPNTTPESQTTQFSPFNFKSYLNDTIDPFTNEGTVSLDKINQMLNPEALPAELSELKDKTKIWRAKYLKSLAKFKDIYDRNDPMNLINIDSNQKIKLQKELDQTKEEFIQTVKTISAEISEYISSKSSYGFDPVLRHNLENHNNDNFIELAQIVAKQVINKGDITCEPASLLTQYINMMIFNREPYSDLTLGVYASMPQGFYNLKDRNKLTSDEMHSWNMLMIRTGKTNRKSIDSPDILTLIFTDSTPPERDVKPKIKTEVTNISNDNELIAHLEKHPESILILLTALAGTMFLVKSKWGNELNQMYKSFKLKDHISKLNTQKIYNFSSPQNLPKIVNTIKTAYNCCINWSRNEISSCNAILDFLRNPMNKKINFTHKYEKANLVKYIEELIDPEYQEKLKNSQKLHELKNSEELKFGEYDQKDKSIIHSLFNYLAGDVYNQAFRGNDNIKAAIEILKDKNPEIALKFEVYAGFIGYESKND